ncbi:LysM peptidoglycan-binding domain-containing protein [Demequina gelatinilytica]|uniref:LysM peptidoglycan-binding domain-containing protein n=1 Tax=Demequina gelatinilytica TaxID=1638980 RepID=UPI0007833834|nr:hypothetical protein [Demequina gelatinilytica]
MIEQAGGTQGRTLAPTSAPTRTGDATALLAALAALTLGPASGLLAWRACARLDLQVWAPGDLVAIGAGALGAALAARFVLDVLLALTAQLRGAAAPRSSGRWARSVAALLAALILGAGGAHAAEPPPSAGWLPATGSSASSSSPPPAATSDPTPAPAPAAPEPALHVVVRGESLWSITSAALGADATPAAVAEAWPVLYEHNRARIGADADLIHPGLRLRLPEGLREARS